MEWNVFVCDINTNEIKVFNIFEHQGFSYECDFLLKDPEITKEVLSIEIQKSLIYYFRARSEWEIVLTSVFPLGNLSSKTIDVYSQVCLNYESFVGYLWKKKMNYTNERR